MNFTTVKDRRMTKKPRKPRLPPNLNHRYDVYEPTLDEIVEGCRIIREEGFVDDRGYQHDPWSKDEGTARMGRKRPGGK